MKEEIEIVEEKKPVIRPVFIHVMVLLGTHLVLLLGGLYVGYQLPHETVQVPVQVTASPSSTPTVDPHGAFTHDNILVRLNEVRLAHGLNQLRDDSFLSSEAQKDLVDNCPINGHDKYRSTTSINILEKNYSNTAEALNFGNSTATDAINSLLTSPTHADVMIGSSYGWTNVGIGVVTTPVNCVSLVFAKQR